MQRDMEDWVSLVADLESDCRDSTRTTNINNNHGGSTMIRNGSAPSSSVVPRINKTQPEEGIDFLAGARMRGSKRQRILSHQSAPSMDRRGHHYTTSGPQSKPSSSGAPSRSSDEPIKNTPLPDCTLHLPMPCTLSLRTWINYYVLERQANSVPKQKIMSWRGSQNDKVNKKYIEQAARVALSLAVKLLEQQSTSPLRQRDVTLDNIVVINTQEGEADFIQTSYDGVSPRDQRKEIYALGLIFYEMFTLGSVPPPSTTSIEIETNTTASTPSFGLSFLQISSSGAGRHTDGSEEEQVRQRRRPNPQDEKPLVANQLQGKGLPRPICRLIADMLENEDYEQNMFYSDNAISTFADLVVDLKQMVDNPKAFLHDSLTMRWKPIIADKLYCREDELQLALEVADRVSTIGSSSSGISNGKYNEFHSMEGYDQQEVLMVSGHSGSGKSASVQEMTNILEKRGWRKLCCKFDRVNPQPLSFITSAFDHFFAQLLARSKGNSIDLAQDNINELKEIQRYIRKSFDEESTRILCQLIPNMNSLISDEVLFCEDSENGTCFDSSDAVASKCHLHHLFGLLLKAISQRKPVLLFLDDLHWACEDSLDLLVALIRSGEEVDEDMISQDSDSALDSDCVSCGVLFVGTFRTNEAATHSFSLSLDLVKSLSNVSFTEIPLNGLSRDNINVMVSESLCYPQRLSRNLSDLIHEKSAGNPLFVKEFLSDLVADDLLSYSLTSRKWEWDEEMIEARTISDGVAELLTRRLLRLPRIVLSALRVVSIIGSQVSLEVLAHINAVCGISDITKVLDKAIGEGLIKKTEDSCSFVHDMIQHSVESGIAPEERAHMLTEISETLIAKTSEYRSDAVLFIIVDLINRLGPEGASTDVDRMSHANLNLIAGEKAMQTPDFGLACNYFEAGISYLGQDYWRNNYNVSLHLYKNAAFVQYALGKPDLMKRRLHKVLDNARNFEDKLDSLNLVIHEVTMTSGDSEQAFEKCFSVLKQLGESFPTSPDNKTIVSELIATKRRLEQYLPSTLSSIPPMIDLHKSKAMEIFPALLMQCYQQKSPFYPLVGCRMANITLQYGMHVNSALGVCGLALAYLTVFQDVSEGYRIGKYSLAITNNKNITSVNLTMYGMIGIWKEPMQAVLPELLRGYSVGLKYGKITSALISSMLYTYRAFLSGTLLSSLGKDVSRYIRQYTFYKRHLLSLSLVPFSNVISSLTGQNQEMASNKTRTANEDKILAQAIQMKELVLAETVVVCKMLRCLIFRDLDEAETIARKYLGFFEDRDNGSSQFMNIYRYFYGGLIAFRCFRKTRDKYWKALGMQSISKFEKWTKVCEWNFHNKLVLLQAEDHFSEGKNTEAVASYKLAISLARDHRFVNEEALSCELAGIYYRKSGNKYQSTLLLNQAADLYESWGAAAKSSCLRASLTKDPSLAFCND